MICRCFYSNLNVIIFNYRYSFTVLWTFFTQSRSLDQAFAHCPIFLTAAFTRSQGRVSVPVWLFNLSKQLRILGLVSHYLSNYLILYELFYRRFFSIFFNIYYFNIPKSKFSHITHPYATKIKIFLFNLHVLSVLTAFILSQDQTYINK